MFHTSALQYSTKTYLQNTSHDKNLTLMKWYTIFTYMLTAYSGINTEKKIHQAASLAVTVELNRKKNGLNLNGI